MEAPITDHIQDLRKTLIKMLMVILFGVIMSFICYQPLLNFLVTPLKKPISELYEQRLEMKRVTNLSTRPLIFNPPEGAIISENTQELAPQQTISFLLPVKDQIPLVILGPLEGILIAFRVSLWVGIVMTSPIWIYFLLQFITPALHQHEKHLVFPFLLTSLFFILGGMAFAFFVTLPIANSYLSTFNESIGINFWSLERYLDYTLFLVLSNGLAFELASIGIYGVHLGLISAEWLTRKRRYAIVSAFIIGALLTPPDVLTQLMLAIPLVLLYEGVIIFAKIRNHNSHAISD